MKKRGILLEQKEDGEIRKTEVTQEELERIFFREGDRKWDNIQMIVSEPVWEKIYEDGHLLYESVAAVIWLARNGKSKEEIRKTMEDTFGYDLSRTCDEIRPGYRHVESCQQTVPEAITAFLEGQDFEDVIRTAVSLGGDCDTLTCIAGSMAEACYGVPEALKEECRKRITPEMLEVLDRFEKQRRR